MAGKQQGRIERAKRRAAIAKVALAGLAATGGALLIPLIRSDKPGALPLRVKTLQPPASFKQQMASEQLFSPAQIAPAASSQPQTQTSSS